MNAKPEGPNFARGIPVAKLEDGSMVLGHVGDEPVLLARAGDQFFAVSPSCTHYHGPLAEGLIVGETVRCPWHHACFNLRTGEAVKAPAFDRLSCWRVERKNDQVFVRDKVERAETSERKAPRSSAPDRIVIVGGGAAGFAAAEMLRRRGFEGSLSLISEDGDAPYDRPNCSKDFLAGTASDEWMPLRSADFYKDHAIDLRLASKVAGLNPATREVTLAGGQTLAYDKLLLATGAEPVRLNVAGAGPNGVHVLRSFADARDIIAAATDARRAVVIGASFIALEVGAALRARGVEVHIVAPEQRPLERILGAELGDFVRRIHEEHGVVFHLQETVTGMDGRQIMLKSGETLYADLVVAGVGVRPRTQLAESIGLKTDGGVGVNEFLETEAPGIFAAGDIARWRDAHSSEDVRIEHWVVAERQGQIAAENMLGLRRRFDDVPFFWSQHYDVPINYVGHAKAWDQIKVEGDVGKRDCLVRYKKNGKTLAVASIYRDVDNLKAELDMERNG